MLFIGRFLFYTCILAIIGGLFLHSRLDVSWLNSWVGNLPGDMTIEKEGMTFYLPIGSAALVSFIFSFMFSLCGKKKSS